MEQNEENYASLKVNLDVNDITYNSILAANQSN